MGEEVSFGHWLKVRRRALDLTCGELAQKIGYSSSALRKIETDERHPSKQLAEILADVLEIPESQRTVFMKVARGKRSIEHLKSSPPPPDLSLLQPSQTLSSPIPTPPTPLIGRETELSALHQMLSDPQCRLITLVGPGGIGKTRLAIESAHNQRSEFAQGVFFVSLATVNSINLIVPTIAGAFGLVLYGTDHPKARLLNFLRDKRIFLILDNLEHLLDGVDLVGEIIEYAPQMKVLCTSREHLSLHGEWVFEVGGLRVPGNGLVERLEDYSAVALFLECARRTRTGFSLSPDNQFSIVQICQLASGIPLAIELAASWLRSLSCHEIAEEINHSLDFLSTSMRDMPERHRSMRAVFDHSWRLLTGDEQRALSRLTVFRGGFTREAAEQVAGANLGLLSALVAKSLLQRSRDKRFNLHELIRQYAARYLETTDEIWQLQRRHLNFFTDFAETSKQHFGGPLMAVSIERMEQENGNLRAALDYAINAQTGKMALRLGAAMWRFWKYRGHVDEGRRWLSAVLALPDTKTDEDALQRAKVLNGAGSLARIQGDFVQARSLLEEGLAIQRKAGNMAGISASLNNLGVLTMFEGQYSLAETYFQESLQICHQLSVEAETVKRLNNLGVVAMYQGEFERARLLHEKAMQSYRELNDQHGMAASLGNLGDVLRFQSQYDLAMQVLQESLAIFHEISDIHGMVITLGSIARVHLAKGDVNQALATFHTSLIRNREVGDKTEIATDLEGIAEALGAHANQSPAPDDEVRLAVRLLAAADQLRAMVGAPRSAAERAGVEHINAQLQGKLSENNFLSESKHGAVMTTEQAVEVTLQHLAQIATTGEVNLSLMPPPPR